MTEFHRHGDWQCLRSVDFVDFYFTDGRTVTCFGGPADVAVAVFLGPVCALLNELAGRPCLHASAVRVGDIAIAFAANSGTGKSSLMASFIDAGHAMISDDILPMEVNDREALAIPAFAAMKLDGQNIDRLQRLETQLAPVVSGSSKSWVSVGPFASNPVPLKVVYVLERSSECNGRIEIETLHSGQSLIELIRFSFCARLVERLHLQPTRLRLLGQVAQSVQVRRCRYPSGLDRLAHVRGVILNDIEANAPKINDSVGQSSVKAPLAHTKRFWHETLQDSRQELA
jgi:hypothetical protein